MTCTQKSESLNEPCQEMASIKGYFVLTDKPTWTGQLRIIHPRMN